MINANEETVRRIIVIDDNKSIHKDFKTVLLDNSESNDTNELEEYIFNNGNGVDKKVTPNKYELDCASQGQKGVEKIKQALSENRPYMVAFVDMRMPPGWDGMETIEHIWQADPNIQIVICSAYSDYSWDDIINRLGIRDNLLILEKPFDVAEVSQLTSALTEKWMMTRKASLNMEKLKQLVEEKTDALANSNKELQNKIVEYQQAQNKINAVNKQLQANEGQLKSINQKLHSEIDMRAKAEHSLIVEKQKAQEYLEVAGVILLVLDANLKVLLINNKGCKVLEYEEAEILGKDWPTSFVPEDARDNVKTILHKLLEGELEEFEYYENPVLTHDQKKRHIAWHNAVLTNENGQVEAILSSGEDITYRREAEKAAKLSYEKLEQANKGLKEMQSQLVQNEKLASIGQLAAGVAHEMNNPVGFVASNFETLENYVAKFKNLITMYEELAGQIQTSETSELLMKTKAIEEARKNLKIDFILEDIQELYKDSKEGLERVTGIIQNLRDFSRIDQVTDFCECNLNDGIKATLAVARNEIKYDCDIKTELSEIPPIFCNSGQINQVFLNILVNASQAIKSQERDNNGTIMIKTYTTDEDVVCEISDDGPGIPEDKLTKIFDPFFTTKPVGKGTGLGLSVSHDIIVNKHKGKLLVDSTVGEGTNFTIKLPTNSKNQNEEKEIINDGTKNCTICG